MDKVVSTFLQTIRCHWLALLQVHLIFNLLGFAIIGPLFGLLLQTAVGLSGHAVVADQDIARLLLTPLGMSAAVLLAGIFLAILAMEMGALLVIAVAARHGLGITALQASGYAIRRSGGLLLLTLIVTLQVLLRTIPLLIVVGTTAWLLMGAHDINFYLTEKTPQFWWTVAITALALAVYCWLVGRQLLAWCLSLPLVLFGARSGYRALRASRDLVGTEIPQVLRAYVLCIGLAVFIPVIPYVLFDFIGGWIVGTPHTRLLPLFLMLGVLLAVWLVLNFFAVALTLASIASVTASLYSHFNQTFSKDRFQSDVASLPGAAHARRGGGIIMVVAAAAAMALFAGARLMDIVRVEDSAMVVAHRGAAGAAPENTMAAVRRAIADGADWVEIDVQESRDGQVVVFHDSDFMKLSGNPLKIWDGDLADIQRQDIGSWFAPEYADERVPTLAQVLEAVRGQAKLMIELKYYGHDQDLEQRVVDLVEAAGMVDEVSVMSLKLEGVKKLQSLRPKWPVGLLAATAVGDLSKVDVDFLALNGRLVTTSFIRRVHASGKRILVWTVNDAPSMSRWMSMGVDGVITDEPALAREVLSERATMNSAQRLLVSTALFLGKPQPQNTYRDQSP